MPSRILALEALCDESIAALPTERIWTLADVHHVPPRERALAFEILSGTIKHRGTIDQVIRALGLSPTRRIEPILFDILRLGAYQLMFLDKVPQFAAVDLSCKLARLYGHQRQVNFVNAVLRNLDRAIETKDAPRSAETATRWVPKTSDRGVLFRRAVLPEPSQTAKHLAAAYSYPAWLVRRWLGRFGVEELARILAAGNGRPTTVCRPNLVRLRREYGLEGRLAAAGKLAEILSREGAEVEVVEEPGAVRLIEAPPLAQLPAFQGGLFQPQDVTSQRIALELAPAAGERILDLCAGLGTKTTQLAELALDQAEIYAADRQPEKLERLRANAARLGLSSIRTVSLDELAQPAYQSFFDAVLVDAPCSNSGVFARRAEARWRIKEGDFAALARGAGELLDRAAELTKPGGRLGYATCSIDPVENDDVAAAFAARHPGWTELHRAGSPPQTDAATGREIAEGGFRIIWRRPTDGRTPAGRNATQSSLRPLPVDGTP